MEPAASSLGQGQWGSMKAIEDHPSAIWLGDLNYRLHLPSGISDVETIKTIRAGHLEDLLEKDQLCREMAAKRVFKVGVGCKGLHFVLRRNCIGSTDI